MSLRSVIQLRGFIEGLPGGSKNIRPVDLTSTKSPEAEIDIILAMGDNTIAVPATASGCIIIFDATSATTKKLKGVAGDAGLVVKPNGWNVLSFYSTPPANFVINSSALDTGLYTKIIFF